MRVIVDTNVFASGIFFSGAPHAILEAWRHGRLMLVVLPAIIEEYRRVVHALAEQFPTVDPDPALALVAIHAHLVEAPPLPAPVCTDPDDDKFLAAALASQTLIVTTGDKALARCHAKLDAAVAAAYGWPADLPDDAILERLLALNHAATG